MANLDKERRNGDRSAGTESRVRLTKGGAPGAAASPRVSLLKEQRLAGDGGARQEAQAAMTRPPQPSYPPPPAEFRFPSPPSTPPVIVDAPHIGAAAGGTPENRRLVFAAAGLVAVVAIAAAVWMFSGSSDQQAGSSSASGTGGGTVGDTSAARPCATPPKLTVRSAQMTPAGLSATTEITATCSTGDVVTDPHFGVSVADGQKDVAAGQFDTASEPIIVPPGGRTVRTFVFPAGTYWRTGDDLTAANLTGVATKTGANQTVTGSAEGASSLTATGVSTPANGSAETAALDGLRDLADADRGTVATSLADRWVPQISSKRPGLVAEGLTWSAQDILREHLQLRQRYDGVRLVWSGDWSTFNGPDWWVTVVGYPSSDAASALQWCDRNSLDADHCYAKMISSSRGVDGTTVLNK